MIFELLLYKIRNVHFIWIHCLYEIQLFGVNSFWILLLKSLKLAIFHALGNLAHWFEKLNSISFFSSFFVVVAVVVSFLFFFDVLFFSALTHIVCSFVCFGLHVWVWLWKSFWYVSHCEYVKNALSLFIRWK